MAQAISLALALVALPAAPLAAASSTQALSGDRALVDFPENAEFRATDYSSFITAAPAELRRSPPLLRQNGWARWKRQVIASEGYQYLVYSAQRSGGWPLYSQGSWIIKREAGSGVFIQAKIFLKSDPGTFIRVYPDGDRSRLDLVIQGGVFAEKAALPWPFAITLVSKVSDIIAATRDRVDWSLLDPDPADYAEVEALASAVRARLHGLRYSDDGGLDAAGKLVFIANGEPQPRKTAGLNCSGFAQWVVDGILKPASGEWLDRSTLSIKHLATRKSAAEPSFEDSLDPYFGLDWTRNLAVAAVAVFEGADESDPRSADVTESPIALIEASANPINGGQEYEGFAPYEEDAGFASEGIPALLWWLAIKDPGYFYLASISAQDKAGLRHHYHVSLFFPRFDEGGVFHVDVFESAAETSLEAVIDRTRGQMIHLVRVRAQSIFDPPTFGATALH
ncbi:MAG TPA: hypothetical protein VMV44_04900 [Rectinemataceae bacterium]|nr:hypothetical protein [Rectinemataceae bacterium]